MAATPSTDSTSVEKAIHPPYQQRVEPRSRQQLTIHLVLELGAIPQRSSLDDLGRDESPARNGPKVPRAIHGHTLPADQRAPPRPVAHRAQSLRMELAEVRDTAALLGADEGEPVREEGHGERDADGSYGSSKLRGWVRRGRGSGDGQLTS
jgi:hypothetical protein